MAVNCRFIIISYNIATDSSGTPTHLENTEIVKSPRLKLQFIENAYSEIESDLIDVAIFDLTRTPEVEDHWGIPRHELVTFPTGDTLSVTAEVTPGPNYLHINDTSRRLVSLKTSGSVELMFLLPSGEEAYASLELPDDTLI